MHEDAAVGRVLTAVIEEWSPAVLVPLVELAGEVWRTNLDRLEPDLGDDAQVLGLQSSFNLRNRAVGLLRGTDGVGAAVVNNTLRVDYRGRVLHTSKAPSGSVHWDVHSIEWESSGVRLDGAAANNLTYAPTEGTLFPAANADPAELRHLHLAWQGLADGGIRAWLGFPRLGEDPWFAVCHLRDTGWGRGTGRPNTVPQSPTPDFDTLQTPEPAVALRRRPAAAGEAAGAAGQ